ncbi:MAG: hypothetical protein AAF547_21365 [Actinomycetota bacterium]
MPTYHWLRVKAEGRTWTDAHPRLAEHLPADVGVWGAFSGLFGIGSNELILVLHTEDPVSTPAPAVTAAGFEIVESRRLAPTVRPVRFEPLTRSGLYVFRLFFIATADIDEIARLSDEAWTTFEHADDYDAQPQGLFAPADRNGPDDTMVLLTWYSGLDAWQTSRQPAPEAAERFRRRRQLTTGTIAYATRLVGT